MCTNACFLTSLKQFLNFTQQKLVKRINICCKVTFGFKYIYSNAVCDITKTCLYNFDPLKPHFYIVKLGFTGVYIIFLISAQNIDFRYSLEPPRQGGSNEYSQFMLWAEIWKILEFLFENFQFLVVKFSVYLNRHVFVIEAAHAGLRGIRFSKLREWDQWSTSFITVFVNVFTNGWTESMLWSVS